MKKILFATVLLVLSVCTYLHGQKKSDSNIAGHAVDARTNQHIPFVTISLKGTTLGSVSDASGHFFLKNLPQGKFTAVASCLGYEAGEYEVDLEAGKTYEINFSLKPVTIDINRIVVSASRNETNRRESPTIVNVVDGELFAKTASNTVAEALNFQSGLRVEYNCGNCGVPQLRINGLEGQYSQILLDSRPIFSSLANVYGLEQLPVGMVERIEVVRGGGSALFGSNAIGGVVNIITKEPVRNHLSVANNTSVIDGKSFDVNTSLNGAFVSEDYRSGIYLFGMVRDREKYDRDKDGFSDIPKLNSETIGFRGYYKTSNYSKLTAEYHHIREFRRGGDNMKRPPHESGVAEQLQHGISGGGLKFDIFSKDYVHRGNIYTSYQHIKRDSYFGTYKDPDAYGNTKDKTFVGGAQYSYNMDRPLFCPSEITAGTEFTYNNLQDVMLGHGREIKQQSRVFGGYLQNEWKCEKVNFIIGARLDKHNKINDPVFSPRANVRYSPSEYVILRAGYASGYRAPQAYDEDLHVEAVGGRVALITIDDNLKPEYSNSITGSADLYTNFGKVHANLLVEGFYTNLKDVFALVQLGEEDPDDKILNLLRVNESGARIGGVNVEGKLALSDNDYLQVGYTWQRSRYKDPFSWSDDENVIPVRRMLRTPDNYGYAVLAFSPFEKAQVSVNGTYTGRMYVPHLEGYIDSDRLEKTLSFFDLGFKFSYDIKLNGTGTVQLSGGIKNIFDSFQKDIDRGADKDAGYIYGPALPRTYFFGVKFML